MKARPGHRPKLHEPKAIVGALCRTCPTRRFSSLSQPSRLSKRPWIPRTSLICRAHARDHDHSDHGSAAAQAIVRSLDSQDDDVVDEQRQNEDGRVGCCTHHGKGRKQTRNSVYRLLRAFCETTKLDKMAHRLEHGVPSNVVKVVLFAVAAFSLWRSQFVADAMVKKILLKISSAATVGVYVFAGLPAAVGLSLDLAALRIDTHVLMNLAVIGALVTGHPLEGALLLILFQGSHAVEHLLTDRAQGSLEALYDAVPETALVTQLLPGGSPDIGSVEEKDTNSVKVDEIVLVKPGWQIPLDGRIVHGRALVSAELISGEAIPTVHREGDEVPAGALCLDGILAIRVLRPAAESTPARIARLAKEAQARRPKLRTWLDRFGTAYSKLVIVSSMLALSLLLYSGVPLIGTPGVERGALYRAMSLLTVASPCALVMVPLAYVSAIAAAASRGVILKGGRVLDAIDACRIVALDKTGTVTTGALRLSSLNRLKFEEENTSDGSPSSTEKGKYAEKEGTAVLAAAALSIRSTHPVSEATVHHASEMGFHPRSIPSVDGFILIPGGGVEGRIWLPGSIEGAVLAEDGSQAPCADVGEVNDSTTNEVRENKPYMESKQQCYQSYFGSLEYVADYLSKEEVRALRECVAAYGGGSIVSFLFLEPIGQNGAFASNEREVWAFVYEDTVRSRSFAAVNSLQNGAWATKRPTPRRSCRVLMLTGDNEASAMKIANQLGIKEVFSGLSPDGKQKQIDFLRKGNGMLAGRGVIMVGDGLNDAAALATADVGIAIASNGAAATSLASDAVVLGDAVGVSSLPMLLRLARATRYVIRQNLALAAGSIAVLALPALLGTIPMWLAVMLHEGSTLLVALNSLRLLRFSASLQRRSSLAEADERGMTRLAEDQQHGVAPKTSVFSIMTEC